MAAAAVRPATAEATRSDEPKTEAAHLPGRLVRRPHGPAVQPHRRRAARLPGTWSPNDPQKTPYDDTGWTFPRTVQRAGRARDRHEGARRADGEGVGRGARPGRRAPAAARSCSSTTTPRRRSRRSATASRTPRSRRPRSRSRRPATRSTAGRSSSRNAPAADLQKATGGSRPAGVRGGRGAVRQDAPAARTARRAAPHVALDAGRRLVAPRVRRRAGCRTPTSTRRTSAKDGEPERAGSTSSSSRRSAAIPRRSSTACRPGATRCRGRRPS